MFKSNKKLKFYKSKNYNYIFNCKNGFFMRWGKNAEHNPDFSPVGPEIMDIEISTICSRTCNWCYKSNNSIGRYMNFNTFKKIFDKFPKTLTQIAFGIGDIDGNPDLFKIMQYCKDNSVIPNITINGERMEDVYYDKLAELCGAVAVSHYNDKTCFEAVEQLSKRGLKQVNIHKLLCRETYKNCFDLIDKSNNVKGLNAIVFLWLKPIGAKNIFIQLDSLGDYKKLVDYAMEKNKKIGFDSCSASSFLKTVKDRDNYKTLETLVEPCESTLFSYYINVDGIGYPCSFSENQTKGVDLLKIKDFMREVWYEREIKRFRKNLIGNIDNNKCRMCPIFDLKLKEK
ncbi:unnamed protein product [marine sediment metagenome]|uniref:Radical SAM core domain-containing protein n=1 Tax=marine sediment metagenome TaxID=412755 RepID=X0SHU2_9ZZZZ